VAPAIGVHFIRDPVAYDPEPGEVSVQVHWTQCGILTQYSAWAGTPENEMMNSSRKEKKCFDFLVDLQTQRNRLNRKVDCKKKRGKKKFRKIEPTRKLIIFAFIKRFLRMSRKKA